jgi:hypothetical protein
MGAWERGGFGRVGAVEAWRLWRLGGWGGPQRTTHNEQPTTDNPQQTVFERELWPPDGRLTF